MNLLFLQNGFDTDATERDSGIDRVVLARFYAQLLAGNDTLKRVLCNAFEAAAANLRRLATTTGFFRATCELGCVGPVCNWSLTGAVVCVRACRCPLSERVALI